MGGTTAAESGELIFIICGSRDPFEKAVHTAKKYRRQFYLAKETGIRAFSSWQYNSQKVSLSAFLKLKTQTEYKRALINNMSQLWKRVRNSGIDLVLVRVLGEDI